MFNNRNMEIYLHALQIVLYLTMHSAYLLVIKTFIFRIYISIQNKNSQENGIYLYINHHKVMWINYSIYAKIILSYCVINWELR